MSTEQRLDLVVFGGTGYTGKFVVRELSLLTKQQRGLKWGIAGRSKDRLQKVLDEIAKDHGSDLSQVEVIEADVEKPESILAMCKRAKVIINCVGPYRFYGEQVVKACIEAQTHHVDVSGEPEYLEKMQLNYNKAAQEKQVFIVGSCGFDSVPADMGLIYTKNNFEHDLNHVESYLIFETQGLPLKFNFATWESAVHGFASSANLGKIRKSLFSFRLPRPSFPVPNRMNFLGYFYDKIVKKFCMHFPGSDKSVVQRTQYFNYENLNQRSIQYVPYMTISTRFNTALLIFMGLLFTQLAKFRFGRYLLLNYYKFFSGGLASKSDRPIQDLSKISFKLQFKGLGFSEKLAKESQHSKYPDQTIITEVSGPEPGYVATSKMVLTCALVLLEEHDKFSVKGGVLTPGAAFHNSTMIERLEKEGIHFKTIYKGPASKANL